MDVELHCNNVQCRQLLSNSGRACVTTCSHIFCLNCANAFFSKALVCPACESSLNQPDDIVMTELSPSEDYKSSVLAGLRPEIIMDICTRAISFYSYQTQQEANFQDLMFRNGEDKYNNLEQQYNQVVRDATSELRVLREKCKTLQKEHEMERRKNQEIADNLSEKTRQFIKLQGE